MSGSSVDADVPTVLRILWGQADGRHDGAHAARAGGPRYAMLPRAETAKALVPSWPPAVTAAVVRNYITPRTRSERRRASSWGRRPGSGASAIGRPSPRGRRPGAGGPRAHLRGPGG